MPRARGRAAPLPARFQTLCEALGELGAWVRLHYVYPYPHVDSVIPLMAEGKILPYLDIPFQHASPKVLEGDAPAGAPGEDAGAHPPLARDLPRPRHPLDLHRRLPWRDGGGLPVPARLAARSRARPRRLLQLRAGRRRPGQRSRRRRAGGGEGGALAPLHGDGEGSEREAPRRASSGARSTSSSTRSTRKARSAARSGTRRRSTAACSSTATRTSSLAISSRPASPTPTTTTCGPSVARLG